MTTSTSLERSFAPIDGAPNALISRPEAGVVSPREEPEFIVIFGWMGARLDHILKYTEGYHKLYPETSIRSILPVVKLILEADPARTLIHVFSNGGCNSLVNVSDGLHRVTSNLDLPLPTNCIIFDSCPGETHWGRGVQAFTGRMKNPLFKYLAGFLILCAFCVAWVCSEVAGRGDPSLYMRRRLLSSTTLPHDVPRTFVYSKGDELVHPNAVEAHAALAKKLGVDVTLELYENTPHVNHLKADPARYWATVSNAWRRSIKSR